MAKGWFIRFMGKYHNPFSQGGNLVTPPGEYGEDSERRISGRSVFMPEFMQVDRVLPLLHMV
jgi:hypothetical protein